MIAHVPARTFLASRTRMLRVHVATGMDSFAAAACTSFAASVSNLTSMRFFITVNYRQIAGGANMKIVPAA